MDDRRIAIVGGGPVGLLAALQAVAEGLEPRVYERRLTPRPGSRSIGLHPPSLALLDRLRLLDRFVDHGVRVERGIAIGPSGRLGAVDFAACRSPQKFVLSIPQRDTENILREALRERAPEALATGAELLAFEEQRGRVRCTVGHLGGVRTEDALALVACDGKQSASRTWARIAFHGGAYEGTYMMADFPDDTSFGSDAAVFLSGDGLVESFPLPSGVRRWVARRGPRATGDPSAEEIAETVEARTGHRLRATHAALPSGFRAERWLASTLSRGRVALAGDAAHVVSPIGGQGMNLGWLGAVGVVRALAIAITGGRPIDDALREDAARRARTARAAVRRAEFNMWLGRPTGRARQRERLVGALLRPPVAGVLANVFTMHGLELGV